MKQILYVDMDNVLVDFPSGINRIDQETREKYSDHLDDVPGIFALMDPMQDAIESYHILAEKYATFILTTAPWNNPSAWMDKLHWVKTHLGEVAYKRLIITHRKDLNKGDFLIDDRENNGAGNFEGTLIRFGSETFPDWQSVTSFLLAAFEHGEDNESIFSALSPDDEDHTPSCPMELIISFQKGDFSEDGTNNFSGKFILDVQRDWEESFHNKFAPFYANVIEGHPLAMLRLTKYMDAGEETDYDFGMELINGEIDIDTNLEIEKFSKFQTVYAIGSRLHDKEDEPLLLIKNDNMKEDILVLKYVPDDDGDETVPEEMPVATRSLKL